MTSRRTPQQKKQLSYEKDRRNTYGERGAHSRHAIRDNKDNAERSRRHHENQLLQAVVATVDEEGLVSIENAVKSSPAHKKRFHKIPDTPLRVVIARKISGRVRVGMNIRKKAR
ncbi:hypothetical protein [Uliginosibacterium sp. TH139]|uniref:hypothetical protein n=1 Tax=Uliginosibacterium sp. TH139 TaxID=2067453 RepID=UPI00117DE1DE|nr:hypothetical protein [Uliginosibacterium sp. TH139]